MLSSKFKLVRGSQMVEPYSSVGFRQPNDKNSQTIMVAN